MDVKVLSHAVDWDPNSYRFIHPAGTVNNAHHWKPYGLPGPAAFDMRAGTFDMTGGTIVADALWRLGSGTHHTGARFTLGGDGVLQVESVALIGDATLNFEGTEATLLIEGTDLKETVRIQSGEMEVSAGGRTASRAFPWSSWMSEWNILRKVGRFPFGADPEDAFCLLEGLTVPKPDAFFTYMGRHDAPDFGGELHVFSMLGRGIVPFDFWLDEEHRLLACISGGLGRAYIPEALMLTEMMHDFVATEFNRERNV